MGHRSHCWNSNAFIRSGALVNWQFVFYKDQETKFALIPYFLSPLVPHWCPSWQGTPWPVPDVFFPCAHFLAHSSWNSWQGNAKLFAYALFRQFESYSFRRARDRQRNAIKYLSRVTAHLSRTSFRAPFALRFPPIRSFIRIPFSYWPTGRQLPADKETLNVWCTLFFAHLSLILFVEVGILVASETS
jgi:hypothetical protein